MSIEQRIEQLLERLSESEAVGFEDLFADADSRPALIVTFLALLEMIRLKLIRVFQSGSFGPIRVYKRARPADAPHPIGDPERRRTKSITAPAEQTRLDERRTTNAKSDEAMSDEQQKTDDTVTVDALMAPTEPADDPQQDSRRLWPGRHRRSDGVRVARADHAEAAAEGAGLGAEGGRAGGARGTEAPIRAVGRTADWSRSPAGYQIVTRPELHEWVRRLFRERTSQKLTVQALETLAVIAYKQPVTAMEIAEIRGVNTTGVVGTLLERGLVKISGRKQVVGRPFLYSTTREFLDRFGLKDLTDLPKVEDMADALGFEPSLAAAEQMPLAEQAATPEDQEVLEGTGDEE